MSLSFIGTYNDRHWIETGYTSLDIATSKVNPLTREITLGIPTRIGIHWYGTYKIGKTTSVTSLAATIAERMGKTVLHVPIDTFDDQVLDIMQYAGLTRNPYVITEETDQKALDAMRLEFKDNDDIGVGILDSVMAVSSQSEINGSVEDRNIGRRASMIGIWVSQVFHDIKHIEQEKIFFATNHRFPKIGSVGYDIPGGKKIQGFTSIHIRLQPARKGMKKIEFDGAWLLNGKVDEHNFGPKGREFNLFLIGGLGIHRGLTAVYDCLEYGLAEERKGVIYFGGDKIARIREMIEDFQNPTLFIPFEFVLEQKKLELAFGKAVKKAKKDEEPEDKEVDLAKVDEEYES